MKAFNLVMHTGGGAWNRPSYIPHAVRTIIDCSPVDAAARHYFWSAVTATYIARPNYRTLNLLASHSSLSVQDYNECIAMFVRHGDKGIEMKLLDFSSYRETAEMMWATGLTPSSRRNFLLDSSSPNTSNGYQGRGRENGTLFITTEDPEVLKEAQEWGKDNNWNIAFTNLFDRAAQTAYKTWEEIHRKGYKPVHDDLEYVSMLLNLQYALKCETWVCTLASNSCRVIDELRATVGGKANRKFADLSAETCKQPPCIEGGQYNYDSR